jgi:2OG-Fe(II) oxygenase superfamily
VIDGLFADDVLERVLGEFPTTESVDWKRYTDVAQHKLEANPGVIDTFAFGPATRQFLFELNAAPFLRFIESLTGIRGLISDPYYWGGGLHQIPSGGLLKIHADFNLHPTLKINRRVNVLVYLNKEWKEEYGGHLELWNREMTGCERRILPIFNRVVVFNTTDFSYHGHPDPIRCPADTPRRSIALYYYTNGRPQSEQSGKHSTLFQERPREQFLKAWNATVGANQVKKPPPSRFGRIILALTPPILVSAWRRIRR